MIQTFHKSSTWTIRWARSRQWKTDTRFGTWDVKSLYRAGSLNTVSRELVRFGLGLVGVVRVRWGMIVTVLADVKKNEVGGECGT